MDITLLILVSIAVLITGISKGGFSGAFGIIAVPMISLHVSPIKAAAIMLPVLCIMDIFTVQKFWKKWDADAVKQSIPSAILGIIIGTMMASFVSEPLLKIIIGLVAIGFVINTWLAARRKAPKGPLGKLASIFWCALGGFTSFISHAGGPPISVFLLRLNLDKTRFVASAALIFAAINYVKLIPYAWLGQLNTDLLLYSVCFAPIAFVGVQVGAWLHYHINTKLFFKLMYALLMVTGVKLLWDGGSGLI